MSGCEYPPDAPLCEAMVALADYARSLGVAPLNRLPGCWEHEIDAHWWVAVNAHRDERQCSRGIGVPPFHAYIEFNGWPAGLINAFGGSLAAGAVANEATFIAAVKAAQRGAARP